MNSQCATRQSVATSQVARRPRRSVRARVLLATIACIATAPLDLRAAEPPVIVSAYQGPCRDGEFSANLATVRHSVAEARSRGSHFVCFPEAFLSGYATPEQMRAGARALDDPELSAFIKESSDHDMVILVGIARITPEGIYNTQLVIHKGALLGTYDKILLTGGDRDKLGFLPGRSIPVFEAHGVKFATIICHDSSFPHVAMAARLKGAQLLFSPHYNFIGEQRMDDHRRWTRNCHVALAVHQRMAVVRSNVVVTNRPGHPGYGDSIILSPTGDPLAEAGLFRTALITAELPRSMLLSSDAWAHDHEVPDWLRTELADALRPPSTSAGQP
jgi:predicted amidohydrolase